MIRMSIELIICMSFSAAYLFCVIFYCVKISLMKKKLRENNPDCTIPKAQKFFLPSVITSCVLEILPYLVPLRPWVIAVVCACGVLSLIIVMRERILLFK